MCKIYRFEVTEAFVTEPGVIKTEKNFEKNLIKPKS